MKLFLKKFRSSSHTLKTFGGHLNFLNKNQNQNLIIFQGPPGSGKGTISKFLVRNEGYGHTSTGDFLRNKISEQTDSGKKIEKIINNGDLICDRFMINVVHKLLKTNFNNHTNVILDGFPRTVTQAQELELLLDKKFKNAHQTIVQFCVDRDFVKKYASANRSICENPECGATFVEAERSPSNPKDPGICDYCKNLLLTRKDDVDPTIVIDRYNHYCENQKKLIQFYEKMDVINLHLECTKQNPLCNQIKDFKQELEDEL